MILVQEWFYSSPCQLLRFLHSILVITDSMIFIIYFFKVVFRVWVFTKLFLRKDLPPSSTHYLTLANKTALGTSAVPH